MEQEAREREKEKERTQSLTGLPAATTGPSGENSKSFCEHELKKQSKSWINKIEQSYSLEGIVEDQLKYAL